ncbi:hypothetical protein RND71_024437 [Anisodus tanguticus]|uniref:Uncharacterized protein n=1 Tax=Anisodus tanguticus TaxID=243964 RepID=A0AAE1V9F8_9SOLA|nr:hypothetical protein RND71_024437 [Anisodus tanguticus]
MDGDTTMWTSNTSGAGVELAVLSENGNFILYSTNLSIAWQSFSHPSDTLLPGQSLTVSLELTSSKSPSHGGYYTLKMLQQPTSLSLALTYNVPKPYEFYSNFSYWSGPEISNVTGDVIAVLDKAGSFGMVYVSSSDGAVYVYKNDGDYGGLSSSVNQTNSNVPSVLRRLTLEVNGNLRLYRWDNDVNGSRQWVPEWAAVSNPWTSTVGNDVSCSGNSSLTGKCDLTSQFKIYTVQKTTYYFSESSVIGNYSDRGTVSKCGDACLSNCDCVASVYGLSEEKAYCWLLRSLEFGGFEDPVSTLFVKVEANASVSGANGNRRPDNSSDESESRHDKVLVLPIVLRAPISFSYHDLQCWTNNFSELLGTGGFGSVYKGSLKDGTLIAVKKLDKVSLHGEKEFITEVKTIGSMNHLNLVRLCGYCSEGTQRNLDMTCDADDFFYPGWVYKEITSGTPVKVVDRQLRGAVEEKEVMRALMVAFWCIQDEVSNRPSMGEVVKMLEGSVDMNMPPMPQTVLELIEEGLDHVYKAMKRELNQYSSFSIATHPSSYATCSHSTMSPR